MKSEINIENKIRFFVLYYGQDVAVQGYGGGSGFCYEVTYHILDQMHEDYLLLTPLSDITDEDAIEVAIISGINKSDLLKEDVDEEGTVDRSDEFNERINVKYWYESVGETTEWDVRDFTIYLPNGDVSDTYGFANNIANIVDYLRSKGYALPWMGYSVEDLVSAGWVKLRS